MEGNEGFSERLLALEQLLGTHATASEQLAARLAELRAEASQRCQGSVSDGPQKSTVKVSNQAPPTIPEVDAWEAWEAYNVASKPSHFSRFSRSSESSRTGRITVLENMFGGPVIPTADVVLEKIRANVSDESRHVSRLFHKRGLAQRIARNWIFEITSLAMVCLSSLWIAVDLDYNESVVLFESKPVFQVMANVFCAYFVGEIIIRFLAFRNKWHARREFWFMFDALLALLIFFETWVMSAVVALTESSMSTGNLRVVVVFRIMRLVRVLRLARIMREVPELMVIIRGIAIAFRAMFVVFTLLCFIIYIAAIIFRLLLEDTALGTRRFNSIWASMGTLLVECTLSGTRGSAVLTEAYVEHVAYAGLMLMFVVLANLTVMGVLGGLLVQTVKTVSEIEKEEARVKNVRGTLEVLWKLLHGNDSAISEEDFKKLLSAKHMSKILQGVDVDLEGLLSMSSFFFEQHGGKLTKPQFTRMLLDLRGKNLARVQDHVETRKYLHAELARVGIEEHNFRASTWPQGQSQVFSPTPSADQCQGRFTS